MLDETGTMGLRVRGSTLVRVELLALGLGGSCRDNLGNVVGGLGLFINLAFRDLKIFDIFSCGFKGSGVPTDTLLLDTVGFQG